MFHRTHLLPHARSHSSQCAPASGKLRGGEGRGGGWGLGEEGGGEGWHINSSGWSTHCAGARQAPRCFRSSCVAPRTMRRRRVAAVPRRFAVAHRDRALLRR